LLQQMSSERFLRLGVKQRRINPAVFISGPGRLI